MEEGEVLSSSSQLEKVFVNISAVIWPEKCWTKLFIQKEKVNRYRQLTYGMKLETVENELQFIKRVLLKHNVIIQIVPASTLHTEDLPFATNLLDKQNVENFDIA